MNVVRWMVQSRIWVALAAASWSIESFVRSEEWVRWTLVTHIFFLTWTAYLFLSDDAIRKHRGLVLIALTGVCVTFQGFENVLVPASCALPVLLYRTHWMPLKWRLARYPLRSVPLVNNGIIAFCWVTLCMVWPFIQAGIDLKSQVPFLLAAFLWILALSMSEDLFVEHTPDATLRLLGNRRLRLLAITLVLISMILSWCYEEVQISVWLSLSASFILLFFMPGGKRTAGKSLLIDAMILLRFPV